MVTSALTGEFSGQGCFKISVDVGEGLGNTAAVTVWPILRGIGGFPVIRIRTGKRSGSRTQSTVWLTAASSPVEEPPEPSWTKMPQATLSIFPSKGSSWYPISVIFTVLPGLIEWSWVSLKYAATQNEFASTKARS